MLINKKKLTIQLQNATTKQASFHAERLRSTIQAQFIYDHRSHHTGHSRILRDVRRPSKPEII